MTKSNNSGSDTLCLQTRCTQRHHVLVGYFDLSDLSAEAYLTKRDVQLYSRHKNKS